MLSKIHSYRLLIRRFCPLGYNIPLLSRCIDDSLELLDGASYDSKSLVKLCHTAHINESVFQSTSNVMMIRFKADHLGNGNGFKLRYNTGISIYVVTLYKKRSQTRCKVGL